MKPTRPVGPSGATNAASRVAFSSSYHRYASNFYAVVGRKTFIVLERNTFVPFDEIQEMVSETGKPIDDKS